MRYLISFLLTALLLTACKKENNNPQLEEPSYMGFATMLLNEEEAEFFPILIYSNNSFETASLTLTQLSKAGIRRKIVGISSIPINNENHQLTERSPQYVEIGEISFHTLLSDGDVLGNYYYLNEQDEIEDFIQFTHIDEETREVKGIFQASFYVDTSAIFDLSSPDTIIITDGYFETVLQER